MDFVVRYLSKSFMQLGKEKKKTFLQGLVHARDICVFFFRYVTDVQEVLMLELLLDILTPVPLVSYRKLV